MASLLERSFACSILWAPNITATATTDSRDHDRGGILRRRPKHRSFLSQQRRHARYGRAATNVRSCAPFKRGIGPNHATPRLLSRLANPSALRRALQFLCPQQLNGLPIRTTVDENDEIVPGGGDAFKRPSKHLPRPSVRAQRA